MKKVLFSSIWGPFTEQYFNTSPTDVMNQRFSRGCDIFTINGHVHMNWAHLIAQNIDTPSVFLEYPLKEDFIAEIEKGYDYVAISSFHNQVDDLIEMCKAVRQKAPKSQIVIGGYGAVGIEATKTAEEVGELCDHLCHEEGISYFRRLLGEQEDKEFFTSHLPKCSQTLPLLSRSTKGNVGSIIGSVGCPNGCDFCGTTEMFKKKRIELMSPANAHKEFQRMWRENPLTMQVGFVEEDSFADIEYMQELGKLLREDSEFGLSHYNFYCLSSMRSMSQWSFEDMMLTGASIVFVGVESKFAKDHGYEKTEGRSYKEMFKGLHNVGIGTTGAWMIGFDFQNRENIEEDLQDFIALAPTTQQLTRVCPFPATPMWHQMKEEGRIRDDVRWEEVSFYGGGGMEPKNFNEHEVMNLIERGYKELYHTHGSSLARVFDVNLTGYEYCRENRHKNKYIGDRSELHRKFTSTLYPMLKAMQIYAPNNIVRKKMKDHRRRYVDVFGEPNGLQKGMEKVLIGLSGLEKFRDVFSPRDNIINEEYYKKYIYDKPAPPYPEYPYRIERPRVTMKYKINRAVKDNIGKFLKNSRTFKRLINSAIGQTPGENKTDGI